MTNKSHAFFMPGVATLAAGLFLASCSVATQPVAPPPAAHPGGGSASQQPPGGLAAREVPQFVQFGFDDNAISGREGSGTTGGLRFVRELFEGRTNPTGSGNPSTFDGTPARMSIYVVTRHLVASEIDSPRNIRAEWRAVADAGHEVGLHTQTHPHGRNFSTDDWLAEIETCRRWLTTGGPADNTPGLDPAEIVGFRTPYLEHGPALFPALRIAQISYDCSIEEGFAEEFDARNAYWPYRIDPSYGGAAASDRELWEIPSYALVVPPDEVCERYGVAPGLRDRLHAVRAYFDPADGKITGFDWNLWVEFGMKPEEVVATFRYTLDQRLAGNRAPLTFGAHSDLYAEQYGEHLLTTAAERREALRQIVSDALSRPEVRVVSARQILDWVRHPAPLGAGAALGTARAPEVHPEVWPVVASPVARDPGIEARVTRLVETMSLEEKVGQVIQAEILNVTPDDIRRYHLGSVLSGGDSHPNGTKHTTPADWVALADAFWSASMDTSDGGVAIPLIWGVDAVHGHSHVTGATIFPHNVGLGATHNPELIRKVGEVTAREMAVTGLDWDFGPTVAVVRNDRWGRTYEGYSEDPGIVRAYGEAMVRGLQGEPGTPGFLDAHHVIATAKHFLGDGGNAGGRDQGDNLSTEAELRDIHGAGYVGALSAGVQSVMASFSSWHGRKMHGNRDLLTRVLKERMGFDGFVVGDWNAHGQLEGCSNGKCPAALNAGIDMFMVPEDWKELWTTTLAAAKAGEIPKERLDDAVRRILRVKMRAGLFERGKPSTRPLAGRAGVLGSAEHRAVAAQAVRQSLVLLKNAKQVLPLRRDQRVVVVGRGANSIGMQTGGWTLNWQGTGNANSDFPGATSIWDGIRAAVESAGGTALLAENGEYEPAVDVAIAVFGEEPYAEFRGDLDSIEYRALHPEDVALLRRLKRKGIPVISLFLTGRPLWVNPELNASDAFVVAWLPGTEGAAVADVLFRNAEGKIDRDFHGRLAYSWPRAVDQTVLNRGDANYDPLFPYGFGLRYADDGALAQLSEATTPAPGALSRTVYFDAGAVAPWRLYVGDDVENPALEVLGTRTATANSTRLVVQPVDRALQGDAVRARWDGSGTAWLFLQAPAPVDLSRESNGMLSLSFDVRVDSPPAAATTLAMGCGADCRAAVDVTDVLRRLPAGQWQTVNVKLRCLESAGAQMARIVRPFELATSGALDVRLSNIRLTTVSEGATICPKSE